MCTRFAIPFGIAGEALSEHTRGCADPRVVDLSQFQALLQPPAQVINIGFHRQAQHDDQREHERFPM
jgi:hypothetical protein